MKRQPGYGTSYLIGKYLLDDLLRELSEQKGARFSLKEYYEALSDAELKERQEFAFEAALRMRDRLLAVEVWERIDVDPKFIISHLRGDQLEDPFQQLLFSKIVPNCKKLGLLDANGGWLRERFTEIGAIQFEDWTDTGEEYELLDEVAKDRAAS